MSMPENTTILIAFEIEMIIKNLTLKGFIIEINFLGKFNLLS
jgi:hypothetical protein